MPPMSIQQIITHGKAEHTFKGRRSSTTKPASTNVLFTSAVAILIRISADQHNKNVPHTPLNLLASSPSNSGPTHSTCARSRSRSIISILSSATRSLLPLKIDIICGLSEARRAKAEESVLGCWGGVSEFPRMLAGDTSVRWEDSVAGVLESGESDMTPNVR